MATKSKLEVNCKILRFEINPRGGQNVFIECKLGQRIWIIERWLNYKTPISMEKFKRDLAKTALLPKLPDDTLAYVKQEADKPFKIKVDI